ncbi:MAG: hypothetical protein NWR03_07910 [Akkermansiaceae bacterium]|nr:hypothetical protein [Akkermansiaceae bacterium]MDP4778598.1 hypothetical protein [Akkermansiaceae bacterium]MDP4897684.1 hypothetical protein [Akkermansiaceae bacterium]MDP4997244.1 hypothetical protein [Akkermansiaceae bacterium]
MNPPPIPTTRNRNIAILLTALVTMVVTSLIWVGLGATVWFYMYDAPPKFYVEMEHPDTVVVGEEFDLVLEITNRDTSSKTLNSIDIHDDFLGGFEVVSMSPHPGSREDLWDYRIFNFNESIKASDTMKVTLKLRAESVGYWAGDVDFTNPLENFVTRVPEIEVEDATATHTSETTE